jgi:hypothetical protein
VALEDFTLIAVFGGIKYENILGKNY